jgi:hypothetical protein
MAIKHRFSTQKYLPPGPGLGPYPMVRAVLSESLDMPEPLLRGAKVNFDFDVSQTPGEIPKFLVDKEKAKLELPRLPKTEADQLPEHFELSVDSPVEDTYGRAGTLRFKFSVDITGRDQQPDGQVELKYNAKAEEIRDVSRA